MLNNPTTDEQTNEPTFNNLDKFTNEISWEHLFDLRDYVFNMIDQIQNDFSDTPSMDSMMMGNGFTVSFKHKGRIFDLRMELRKEGKNVG